MSVKEFIIVTRMQNVLIMKDLSPVGVSQVMMEMGLLIVSVSSKIEIFMLLHVYSTIIMD